MKINFSWKNPMCTMLQNSSILIKSCFYTVVSENCSVFLSIIVFSFVFRIEIIPWGRIALWAVWPGSRSFLFLSHVSTTPVFTLCPWSRSFPCLNHASTTPVFILCPWSRSFPFLNHVSTTPVLIVCPWSRPFPFFKSRFYHASPCLNHVSITSVFIVCPWSRSFPCLNHVSTTPVFIVCPWSRSFPFFKSRFYHVSLYCVSLI